MSSWPPLSAVIALVFVSASATSPSQAGPIYFGMDAPLTGPTQLVGQSDRQAVEAVVAYWNSRGGIRGRRVVVDVLDNASNPSQAVQNVQKFISDSQVRRHLRLGERRGRSRDRGDREPGEDPVHRALTADAARRAAAAVRLHPHGNGPVVRVQRGGVPEEHRHQARVAHGRQWRVRAGRPEPGFEAREEVRPRDSGHDDLLAGFDRLLRRADEDQELQRAGAVAVDGDACGPDDREAVQAAPAAAAARADRRQRLAAVPPGHVRRRERRDRQLVPRDRMDVPAEDRTPSARRPRCSGNILKRPVSNFDGDAAGALWAYKAAIERGGATRAEDQQRTRDEAARARDAGGEDLPLAEEPSGPPARLDVGRQDPELPGQAAVRPGLHEEEVAMRAPQTTCTRRLRRS